MTRQEIFSKLAGNVNSTTFLTGMGVTGVVTTAYLTGRASFKAAEFIRRDDEQRRDVVEHVLDPPDFQYKEATFKEKVKLVWPLYVAPVSTAATTITAIVMANHEASKKIAALTVASGISERALQEYKAKVVEKLGENKERGIRDEIAQDRVKQNPPTNSQVMIVGNGDVLCFDMITGRYFTGTMEKIRQAENKINYEILVHDYASLSSFYDEIGLQPTVYSDTVGWNSNQRLELSFSTVMSQDDRPCIAIDFVNPPFIEYSHLW